MKKRKKEKTSKFSKNNNKSTKKILFSVLISAFVIFGVFIIYRSFAARFVRRNLPVKQLVLMSWNIRLGGQRMGRNPSTIAGNIILVPNRPDIIFLQEVYSGQVQDIANNLTIKTGTRYYWTFGGARPTVAGEPAGQKYGVAILSRYPFEDSGAKFNLPRLPGINENRVLLKTGAKLPGNFKVTLANTHFTHKNDSVSARTRNEQAKEVVRRLPDSERFTILGGDFNTGNGTAPINILKNQGGFLLAENGNTLPVSRPTERLDFMGIKNIPQNITGGRDWVVANQNSDHRPIMWVLNFR